MQSIRVRHNIEMAHRLWDLPGKCQQIHGHSWWCELTLFGPPDGRGIILDFHEVKVAFRAMLDSFYDHHLALDKDDPLIQKAYTRFGEGYDSIYPGVRLTPGMPTVENMSKWIGEWAQFHFSSDGIVSFKVDLWEAATNAATWQG